MTRRRIVQAHHSYCPSEFYVVAAHVPGHVQSNAHESAVNRQGHGAWDSTLPIVLEGEASQDAAPRGSCSGSSSAFRMLWV